MAAIKNMIKCCKDCSKKSKSSGTAKLCHTNILSEKFCEKAIVGDFQKELIKGGILKTNVALGADFGVDVALGAGFQDMHFLVLCM